MTSQAGGAGVHVTPASGGAPPAAGAYPPGYLDGFGVTRTSGTVVGIGAGFCRDSTNAENLEAGALSCNIAINGANGLDTGAAANNTWYSVWIIGGGGNPVASLMSTSETVGGLTLPGTYTVARRIAWTRRLTGAWIEWKQVTGEGRVRWMHYPGATLSDVEVLTNGNATSWTDVDCTEQIPPGQILGDFVLKAHGVGTGQNFRIRPKGETEGNVANRLWCGADGFLESGTASSTNWCNTDAGRILQYDDNGTTGAYLWVLGYADQM